MVFNDKTYDKLKWIAQYLLPGIVTLWLTVSKLWSLPYGAEIGGTISAIDTFLGIILGISSHNYQGDGKLVINEDDPEKDTYVLELDGPVQDLGSKNTITFKVVK